jgi:hypothetical protein
LLANKIFTRKHQTLLDSENFHSKITTIFRAHTTELLTSYLIKFARNFVQQAQTFQLPSCVAFTPVVFEVRYARKHYTDIIVIPGVQFLKFKTHKLLTNTGLGTGFSKLGEMF